jgi:hypothetical protein
MKDVEDFAAEHDLHDIIGDLKKGALVAQNPAGFNEMEELSPEEKDALRFEVTNKWTHPMRLYVTIVICSIGAAVQYETHSLLLHHNADRLIEDGTRLARMVPTCLFPQILAFLSTLPLNRV